MSIELEVVAISYTVFEAEFLRNQLEAKGFEVYLADDHTIGIYQFLAPLLGGIKIKVPNTEAAEATAYISDLRNAEIIYDEDFPEE